VPEIKILQKNLYWDYLNRSIYNNSIGRFVNIDGSAHIHSTDIGDYSYIAINSWISHATIGKFCSIGPNFLCGWGIHPTNALSTSPMFYSTMKQNGTTLSSIDKIEERKPIKIGNDVFIGANVIVLDGITIGDGAVIGAGAVVSKDIPPYAIAVGSPIQIIKYRFEKDDIDSLLKIKWWNFDEEKLKDVERMFFDINAFLAKYQ
jgi:acetyltransferase-like isoleucine patch superfamily enzyme